MDFDLVIQDATLVTAEEVMQADIGVCAGKIAALGSNLQGRERVVAAGKLVIPGGVDAHVHLEMPTATTETSDDWVTGTQAAACGGTTTVIDFVEPREGEGLLEALEMRRAQAQNRSAVDYALHMTLTNANPATLMQIPSVMAAGATSFKTYTTYAGFALDDEQLVAIFATVGAAGGLVMLHAENNAIIQYSLAKLRQAGNLAPANYPASRPAIAEIEAIQRAILLARFSGVPLYIVHISTGEGAEAVANARCSGQLVYGETCPQYLLLDESLYQDSDPLNGLKYICAPPLRSLKDQQALWMRLRDGAIQSIGTDHCAFNLHGQKDQGLGNFANCPGGVPGIEARLALVYSFGVKAGHLSLEEWVSRCSTAPAQIFGLYPRKGSLHIGADADLVIFDPEQRVTITRCGEVQPGLLHENVDYTPYEGFELEGWPVATFLRGSLIVTNSQFTHSALTGEYLSCQARDKQEV